MFVREHGFMHIKFMQIFWFIFIPQIPVNLNYHWLENISDIPGVDIVSKALFFHNSIKNKKKHHLESCFDFLIDDLSCLSSFSVEHSVSQMFFFFFI